MLLPGKILIRNEFAHLPVWIGEKPRRIASRHATNEFVGAIHLQLRLLPGVDLVEGFDQLRTRLHFRDCRVDVIPSVAADVEKPGRLRFGPPGIRQAHRKCGFHVAPRGRRSDDEGSAARLANPSAADETAAVPAQARWRRRLYPFCLRSRDDPMVVVTVPERKPDKAPGKWGESP